MTDDASLGRQAEKSRRTREKILASTISLIREGGLSAASSKRIAERAGLTWGAAQHHFGSKEQILRSVIMLSHERFLARLADMDGAQGSIAERVSGVVDRMWAHYQDETYLAAIEIIMAGRDIDASYVRLVAYDRPGADHVELMTRTFGDSGAGTDALMDALIFVHCLLTGLTIQKMLEGSAANLEGHLRRAKAVMTAMIGGS